MNRDWEEKRIAKSFQELKREDEASAPPFDLLLKRASFEQSAHRRAFAGAGYGFRAAAIVLIFAGAVLTLYFTQSAARPARDGGLEPTSAKIESKASLSSAAGSTETTIAKVDESDAESRPTPVRAKRSRAKRLKRVEEIDVIAWRPPTDFLLRASGEELFKSIPRLGEPLTEIEFDSVQEN